MPDVGSTTELRDRAIHRTFYSTGMRRLELVITSHNLDAERGTDEVRAKGKKGPDDPHRRAGAGLDPEVPGARPRPSW